MHLFTSYSGGEDLPINIHATQCYGNETRLIDCDYEIYPVFYCSHATDVGITCKAYHYGCQ